MFKRTLAFLFAIGLALMALPASADTTISALTTAPSISTSDYLVVVHSGTTYKATTAQMNAVYADLVNAQTIAGVKTFSSAPVMSGASITSGTIPITSVVGTAADLTTSQTIAGIKTFSSAPVMSGASITSGTIPMTALAATALPVAQGGTGSISQNFVDLSTTQTIGGAKTFSSPIVTSGNITINQTMNSSSGGLILKSASGANGVFVNYGGGGTSGLAVFDGGTTNHSTYTYNGATVAGNVSVNQTLSSSNGALILQSQSGSSILANYGGGGSSGLSVYNGGTSTFAPVLASAFTVSSDRRYKKNIERVPYGLATVEKLKPSEYTVRATGKRDLGFIAQDVKKLIPELVSVMDKKTGSLGLNYTGIIPVLTRAIQEQQKEILQLRAEVKTLSAKR